MKIKEFIKKNYVLLIPISLIIIMILTYSIYKIDKYYDSYIEDTKAKLYQYFAGTKVEDEYTIKSNRKKEIVEYKSNRNIDITSNPIYYSDIQKVIFQKDMNLIQVYDGYHQSKIYQNTTLEYDKNNTKYTIKGKDYNKDLSKFVLYDGEDLYFFPEDTILQIGNKSINLSYFSYVKVNVNNSIEYYDYESDKYEILDYTTNNIYASNNCYRINLAEDKIISYNDFILLKQIKYLDTKED